MPSGTGSVNKKGLDFYDKLTDTLLEHNITPSATLFHWDYPYSLYCKGDGLTRNSPFMVCTVYAQVVIDKIVRQDNELVHH